MRNKNQILAQADPPSYIHTSITFSMYMNIFRHRGELIFIAFVITVATLCVGTTVFAAIVSDPSTMGFFAASNGMTIMSLVPAN